MIQWVMRLVHQRKPIFNKIKLFKFSDNYEKSITSSLDNRKKYYKRPEVGMDIIFNIFQKCKLEPKYNDSNIRLKYCPVCTKPHNEDASNLNTCIVYKDSLVYHCFRCGRKGKFQQLLRILRKSHDLEEYSNFFSSSDYSTLTEMDDSSFRKRVKAKEIEVNNSENDSIIPTDDIEHFNTKKKEESNSEEISIGSFESNQRFTQLNIKTNNIDTEYFNTKQDLVVKNISNSKFKISLNNIGLINELYKRHMLLNSKNGEVIKDYLVNQRKLSLETLTFYRVGVSYEKFKDSSFNSLNLPTVSFPMFYPITRESVITVDKDKLDKITYEHFRCEKFYLSKIKIRAIGKELKHFQRIEPTGAILW
jgi:hypothetical protein